MSRRCQRPTGPQPKFVTRSNWVRARARWSGHTLAHSQSCYFTMATSKEILSHLTAGFLGSFCLLTVPAFLGWPFPTARWKSYYADKSGWMSRLSRGRLSHNQAGIAGAILRLSLGLGILYRPTRIWSCIIMDLVVLPGTYLAVRDGRPLAPQWKMLGLITATLVISL